MRQMADPGSLSKWTLILHVCVLSHYLTHTYTHTRTHPFNGPFSGTTWVSQYQKGKTNLDFTEARDSEWQWHQLGHMQVCISLQTDNHASTPPLIFYRPDALPAAHPTASKHWRRYPTHTRAEFSQVCTSGCRKLFVLCVTCRSVWMYFVLNINELLQRY